MLRLIVLAVLLLVVFWLVSRWLVQTTPAPRRDAGSRPPPSPPEPLLRCSACGVRVPESRAVPAGQGGASRVCSEGCRRRAEARSA